MPTSANYTPIAAETVAGARRIPLTPRHRPSQDPEVEQPHQRLALLAPAPAHSPSLAAQSESIEPSNGKAKRPDTGLGNAEATYFGLDLSTPRDSQGYATCVPVSPQGRIEMRGQTRA